MGADWRQQEELEQREQEEDRNWRDLELFLLIGSFKGRYPTDAEIFRAWRLADIDYLYNKEAA